MAIEEAFEHMDEGMEANVEVVNNALNEVNLGERGADTMESRMEELRKQHAEKIREYKARIFELENQVATLTMGEAGSSSCTLINPIRSSVLPSAPAIDAMMSGCTLVGGMRIVT